MISLNEKMRCLQFCKIVIKKKKRRNMKMIHSQIEIPLFFMILKCTSLLIKKGYRLIQTKYNQQATSMKSFTKNQSNLKSKISQGDFQESLQRKY